MQKLVRSERKCLFSLGGIGRDIFVSLQPKHRTNVKSKILHYCDMNQESVLLGTAKIPIFSLFFDLRKAGRKREILRITDNIEIIIPYKSAVRSG